MKNFKKLLLIFFSLALLLTFMPKSMMTSYADDGSIDGYITYEGDGYTNQYRDGDTIRIYDAQMNNNIRINVCGTYKEAGLKMKYYDEGLNVSLGNTVISTNGEITWRSLDYNLMIWNPRVQNKLVILELQAKDSSDNTVSLATVNVIINPTATDIAWVGETGYTKIEDAVAESNSGTDDIVLKSAEGLTALAEYVNGGNNCARYTFKLGADIDLDGVTWTPIGTETNPFKGIFDGVKDSYTISNLTINDSSLNDVGLFGYTDEATLKDIKLSNVSITAHDQIGAIVGRSVSTEGTTRRIDGCEVSGTISLHGNHYVGGIVGHSKSDITGCTVTGSNGGIISAKDANDSTGDGDDAGGIVGYFTTAHYNGDASTVTNCSVSGVTVEGFRQSGGLIGLTTYNTSVSGCSVSNATINCAANADTAAITKRQNQMEFGGLIGAMQLYHVTPEQWPISVSNCSVSDITLTSEEAGKDVAKMGYVTGGLYSSNASTVDAFEIPEGSAVTGANITVTNVSRETAGLKTPETAHILLDGLVTYVASVKHGDKTTEYTSAQAALDAAVSGDTVTLYAGDHGTLYIRQNSAVSVGVDVIQQAGENWGTNDRYRALSGVTIQGQSGTVVNQLVFEAGAYYGGKSSNPEYTNLDSIMEIDNMTIKNVDFVLASNTEAIDLDKSDLRITGLTIDSCSVTGTGNHGDSERLMYGIITPRQMTSAENSSLSGVDKTDVNFTTGLSNVVVKDSTFTNLHQVMEVRGVNNLEFSRNKVTGMTHQTIIALSDDQNPVALRGTVKITDNTIDGTTVDRVFRMNKANAAVTITGNTVTNYSAPDKDLVKASSSGEDATYMLDNNSWMGQDDMTAYSEGKINIDKWPEFVAQIGNTKYTTLADAVSAAKNGDTIKLLADIELSNNVEIEKSFALDLAGHAITSDHDDLFYVKSGTFTIDDSVGGGSIYTDNWTALVAYGGNIIVNGGKIGAAYGNATYPNSGYTITFNGGMIDQAADYYTVKSGLTTYDGYGDDAGYYFFAEATVTAVSPSSFEVPTGSTETKKLTATHTCDAIKWNSSDASIATVDQDGIVTFTGKTGSAYIYVADASTGAYVYATATCGSATVVKNTRTDMAYASLQVAIDAAESGDTLQLLDSYTLPVITTFPKGKTLTLDLAGKTLTASGNYARLLKNYGKLTITGSGTITNSAGEDNTKNYSYGLIDNYGKLTVDGGTFNDYGMGAGAALKNRSGATMTIKSGTSVRGYGESSGNATIRSSGTLTIEDNVTLQNAATDGNAGFGNGVYCLSIDDGEATIGTVDPDNPSTINGNRGALSVSGGTVTVNSGTFTGTIYRAAWLTNDGDNTSVTINGGKFIGGDGLLAAIDDGNQDASDFSLIINDGYFDKVAQGSKASKHKWTVAINGGYYKTKPVDTLLANDYEAVDLTNSETDPTDAAAYEAGYRYKVESKYEASVTVGNTTTNYNTLAEAFAAANASESAPTVTLLKNVETGSSYTHSNPLILSKEGAVFDLDGNTLTVTKNFSLLMRGSNGIVKNGNIVPGITDKNVSADWCRYGLVVDSCEGVKIKDVVSATGIAIGGDPDEGYTPNAGPAKGVTVENCTVSGLSDRYALFAQNGSTVTIESGTYNKASGGTVVLFAGFSANDGGSGSITVTGGNFQGTLSPDNNKNYIILKGGKYTINPSDLVAEGYEAVPITDDTYSYQVGKIKATDFVIPETTEETVSAQCTAKEIVVDTETGKTIATGNTMNVNVTTTDGTVEEAATLSHYDLADIVESAIATADINSGTIDVEIKIVRDNPTPTESTPPTITYEVHPEATVKVNDVAVGKFIVSNDELKGNASFTLKLPVPDAILDPNRSSHKVTVKHISEDADYATTVGTYDVEGSAGNYYVEVEVSHFSQFELEESTEAVTAKAELSATLALGDSIDIIFYANISGYQDVSKYKATYTFNGKTTEKTFGTDVKPQTDGRYRFVVASCAAKEMTMPTSIAITYDGEEVASVDGYTIQKYCNKKIKRDGKTTKLGQLCYAVLDYGASAQDFFGYEVSKMANATYSDIGTVMALNIPKESMWTPSQSGDIASANLSAVAATLNLVSQTELYFYLTPSAGQKKDDYDFKVTDEKNDRNMTFTTEDLSDGRIRIAVKGISARHLGHNIKLDVNKDVYTLSYSPMTYACKKQAVSDEKLSTLSKALYQYYKKALAMLGE